MGQPSTGHLDPRELLERLRSEHRTLRWEPLLPSDDLLVWRRSPMHDEESLEYLHHHWMLPTSFSGRRAQGGVKERIARRVAGLVFRAMGPYLHAEQEMMANLVRTSDSLARRCDDLARVITERQEAEAESQARLAALIYDTIGSVGESGEAAS